MCLIIFFFLFTDAATTEIYTLSLHDALPICHIKFNLTIPLNRSSDPVQQECRDRKSGSAGMPRPISYAVFCLKKKTARPCYCISRPSLTAPIWRGFLCARCDVRRSARFVSCL